MSARPALDTLRDLRDGRFLDDLSTELNELVRAVRETDKAGEITIKLIVKPVNNDATSVTVTDTLKVKEPKLQRATLFFTTPESNLSRRDPRQPEIPGLIDASARGQDLPDDIDDHEETDTA